TGSRRPRRSARRGLPCWCPRSSIEGRALSWWFSLRHRGFGVEDLVHLAQWNPEELVLNLSQTLLDAQSVCTLGQSLNLQDAEHGAVHVEGAPASRQGR